MVKTILAILGLVVVCLNPILSGMFLTAAATRWHAEKTLRRPPEKKKEPASITKPMENKGFTTYKEMQEKNCEQFLKPGFQDDPEWQRKTAEIHKIMDENRRIQEEKRANRDWR
jgi:delta 1-pyrroline-5-carboxylate dehydrogenase